MNAKRLENLVAAQAERTPDHCALVFGDQKISYRELESLAKRICGLLIDVGCQPGDRVCLFMPKGIDAIASMLGVLKAGAAYVPIDLASPAARVQRIVDSCEPGVILVAAEGEKLLSELMTQGSVDSTIIDTARTSKPEGKIKPDTGFWKLGEYSQIAPELELGDSDPAHVLFTSGSTGIPKGVIITHRNVVGFLDWATNYFEFTEGEQISGHPPLHFDLSTFDIYGALTKGLTLHLVSPKLNLLAPMLAEWIRSSRLTQWFSVPSIMTYMAKFDVVRHNDFPEMKRLLWCGEVLPTPTLMYWMERLPHVTFTNLYGPTEATIASSFYTVADCPKNSQDEVPIGTACTGEELLILDEHLQSVPDGEIGDLYIGGIGLSPGYWRDPAKTAAAFIADPRSSQTQDRIYKTGDLGLRDQQGHFRYVGRADSQIKSRGHRIELGEIESAVNAIGCTRECAVVGVDTGGFEGVAICCAFVPDGTDDLTPARLRNDLASLIPRYMLPARWREFQALPKNANGKIDRSRIRDIFAEESNASREQATSPSKEIA